MKIFFILIILISLSACSLAKNVVPQNYLADPVIESELAKMSLNNFLSLLNLGQYEQAVFYFDGDWTLLQNLNPNIDPEAKSKLLEQYCLKNGGQCLKFIITSQQKVSDNLYRFSAQFFNSDGSIYKTPGCPCKGGGKSEFEFKVKKVNDGQFLNIDLPPQELKN